MQDHLKYRIAYLDLLRFIAAFIVFSSHCYYDGLNLWLDGTPTPVNESHWAIYYFLCSGGVGVCIFFLISGYLMPAVLPRFTNYRHFLANRLFRIFPLFVLFFILYSLAEKKFRVGALVLPLADFANIKYALGGVDWSLRIEFLYYLIIGYVFFYRNLTVGGLLGLQLGLFAAGGALKAAADMAHIVFFNNLIASLLYVMYILFGSMVFLAEKDKEHNHRLKLLLSLVLVFAAWHLLDKPAHDRQTFFAYIGFGVFFAFYFLRNRIAPHRLIGLLGALTYPLYLSHRLIYPHLYEATRNHLLATASLLLLCYVLHRLVEQPCIEYGKRVAARRGWAGSGYAALQR